MARNALLTRVELTRIHCHDEGDGPGSAEPYLWAVFFKVDGETVAVTPALTLSGEATIRVTPGSHGNLPNSDVDDGEDISIPSEIGEWLTGLKPIPVPESLSGLIDDVGGVLGLVTVLMEEDNVTDSGAEAGHQAFNAAVREAVNQIVATRSVTNQDVNDEELAAFEDQISDAVRDAVADQQNVFENIWSWLNADDTIGFKVFTFTHDQLDAQRSISFNHRWPNEGDWEIFGSVTATRVCPAEVLQEILDGILAGPSDTLEPLRVFRDGPFREHPGLMQWWRALERNTPSLALLLARDSKLRSSAAEVWHSVIGAAADLDSTIDDRTVQQAAQLAREISRRTASRRLRIDASRAADQLPSVRGRTAREAVGALAKLQLARNPRLDNSPIGHRETEP